VSLDSDLLDRFDKFVAEKGYDSRSEAFRDLIRDRLVGTAVVAAVPLRAIRMQSVAIAF
jgi:CopG family transcriptional regulator, nickel-responsive regulator